MLQSCRPPARDTATFIPPKREAHRANDAVPFRPKIEADRATVHHEELPLPPQVHPEPREEETTPIFTAMYPKYAIHDDRLNTYADWPKSLKQKPHQLSEAGFFYIGKGDKVMCYFCGVGLNEWDEDDDPWEEHALWYPECEHVLLTKGQEFVDMVQEKKMPEATGRINSYVASEEKPVETKKEEELQEERTACKICLGKSLEVLLEPCGHLVSCIECSLLLKNCPVCRAQITKRVRAYW